jgi:hypothetical protein
MARTGIKLAVVGLLALASLGLLVQPAAAFHAGATVNCGTVGTFTVRATPNAADFESPPPNAVLLFDEGGTLSILEVYRNGQLVWNPAHVGRASNNVEEVTCSYTLANGVQLQVTGVFTGH